MGRARRVVKNCKRGDKRRLKRGDGERDVQVGFFLCVERTRTVRVSDHNIQAFKLQDRGKSFVCHLLVVASHRSEKWPGRGAPAVTPSSTWGRTSFSSPHTTISPRQANFFFNGEEGGGNCRNRFGISPRTLGLVGEG